MKISYTTYKHIYLLILFFFSIIVIFLQGATAEERLPETNRPPIKATLCIFTAFDETEQLYFEYVPQGFDKRQTTTLILALHGHGSDLGQIFNGVHAEFNAILDVASISNAIVVSPQYRGTTSWMGSAAEKDIIQVIVEQKARRRIDRIVIAGASMGGSSALTFTSLHPELVDAVVAMNGTANHLEYEHFQDAIIKSFGGTKSEIPLEYKKRSAEYFPESFLGKPTAITLGSLDDVVEPDSARRLATTIEKIGGDVLLIERNDEGHHTRYADAKEALEYVFKALDSRPRPEE